MPEACHVVCPHCASVNRVPQDRPAGAALCGGCHRHLFDGQPVEVDEAGCERHIRANGIPVLLDIWAPWCGPCRTMAPAFAQAARTLEPGFRLIKLNADTAPGVTSRLGVRGIPALFLFRNGTAAAQTAGALDTASIVAWARRHAAETGTITGRLGDAQRLLLQVGSLGEIGIIPFWMEYVALDIEGHHLRIADLDALRVVACIKLASHHQASPGRGGRNQFDHRFPAGQGFAAPSLSDMAEQPMFGSVPIRLTQTPTRGSISLDRV